MSERKLESAKLSITVPDISHVKAALTALVDLPVEKLEVEVTVMAGTFPQTISSGDQAALDAVGVATQDLLAKARSISAAAPPAAQPLN